MNSPHGEPGHDRGAMRRRTVLLGAGAAAVLAAGVTLKRPRRILCYLFPASHAGNGEMRGVTGREDAFAGAPFESCHASTLAAGGANLVCAWFRGWHEGHPGTAIWIAARGRDGWSPPRMVVDGGGMACWNPVLWQAPGGPLHLFYKAGESPRTWRGMAMQSDDGGESWSPPAALPDGILGPVRSKPLLLPDGRLLCPSSTEHDGWRVHFEWTADGGRTWSRTAPLNDGQALEIIQPTLLRHAGGRLQALCRSRQGVVVETWSADGGTTWSEPVPTALPNPNSAIDALTLADGRHLLVHNPVPRCRSPLVVSVSDDGRNWHQIATLENGRGEFSYPAVIQDQGGTVWISYTNRRKRISLVRMDPSAI